MKTCHRFLKKGGGAELVSTEDDIKDTKQAILCMCAESKKDHNSLEAGHTTQQFDVRKFISWLFTPTQI